ncbi:flagellar hook-length control protein FliK [Pseudoalteromonas fuliginea]|uniref:Flagellar hook-length control protein FliK n=2 Tax=Pseudoalteromonas fuliginea TaxID=1872678 RepID=A0ABD3Y4X8_9GAMM|nr:flagellar hook-length control protein FliK [Pseudoalteromonas fuliginea]KDC49253.1 flagellar hook-length control protein FliK [Pseudoalteromonas fuliginea]KJZ28885.1 flagellar hook-length control protein FliK [Pseudoalteromonas fuliginea]
MVMNDISSLVASEQDSYLASKDNRLAKDKESNDTEFLNQLHSAHNSIEAASKRSSSGDAKDSIRAAEPKQAKTDIVENEQENQDNTNLSGDSMLAQINSAQAIDISVKKHSEQSSDTIDTDLDKTKSKSADNIISSASQNIGQKAAEQKSTESQATDKGTSDAPALNKSNINKGFAAEKLDEQLNPVVDKNEHDKEGPIIDKPGVAKRVAADESQIKPALVDNKQTPKGEITNTQRVSNVDSQSSNSAAVETLLSKDDSAIKLDKILSSLTPEQREQLITQSQTVNKSTNNDNITALKQMLNAFVTENNKPQALVPKQSFNAEISALTTTEKQALLSQLTTYIKTEQPQGAQLTYLKEAVSVLETSINFEQPNNKITTFVAGETPNTVYNPQKQSVKSTINENSIPPDQLAEADDDLIKQLDMIQKDGSKINNAEQLTPRSMKLFTQITGALDTLQRGGLSNYDTLGYEQAILDTQVLQSQQLQSTAQGKQMSIDPGVMQAVNIIKSDAAKLLQERVSSMLSINNKEAEIRLDPPEMGSMQIRIRSDAEQAQINFVVQNQQAKEALEQSLPRLREMLAQQGIELGDSSISYGDSKNESTEQNDDDSKSGLVNKNTINEENADSGEAQLQSSRQQTSSAIDYYA